MLFRPALHPLLRSTLWVLLLWLCVLAASVGTPLARAQAAAQGMERLCSGHGSVQWVVSALQPTAAHAANSDHLIDCPLCLPALGPPLQALNVVALPLALPTPPAGYAAPVAAQPLRWPPARGPPSFLL